MEDILPIIGKYYIQKKYYKLKHFVDVDKK